MEGSECTVLKVVSKQYSKVWVNSIERFWVDSILMLGVLVKSILMLGVLVKSILMLGVLVNSI